LTRARHRHELSDQQWHQIRPLLPRHGRRSTRGDRTFINAVLFLMKTGCPWRDLPERYGNWKTVYNRFANWSRAGHWESIFKALRMKVDKRGSLLDATIARAHPRDFVREGKLGARPARGVCGGA